MLFVPELPADQLFATFGTNGGLKIFMHDVANKGKGRSCRMKNSYRLDFSATFNIGDDAIVCGGISTDNSTKPNCYNLRTGKFIPIGKMARKRSHFAAIPLNRSSFLVYGMCQHQNGC